MKTLAPAVPPVLVLGTRWQAECSVQLALRLDLYCFFVSQCLFKSHSVGFCVRSQADTATAARRCTMPRYYSSRQVHVRGVT